MCRPAAGKFWARLHEIGTFPSRACHIGRKQLQSVFLGPFLESNGPVWHSRRPVGPFWLTFGGLWAFLETKPAKTPYLQAQKWPTLGHQGPKNLQNTNLFGHQHMPRHHGLLQCPLQCTWFGPQIWLVEQFAHSAAVSPIVPHLEAPAHLAQD